MIQELTQLIVAATRDLAVDQGLAVPAGLDADVRLFGQDGLLDSMALVSLVVSLEQLIEEKYGVPIALADEKALSQRSSPYRTIGSLAAYAAGELEARRRHG
jgi:acyl carrier protein